MAQLARLSFNELGRRVSLSPPAVADRVRRMEREGVIRGLPRRGGSRPHRRAPHGVRATPVRAQQLPAAHDPVGGLPRGGRDPQAQRGAMLPAEGARRRSRTSKAWSTGLARGARCARTSPCRRSTNAAPSSGGPCRPVTCRPRRGGRAPEAPDPPDRSTRHVDPSPRVDESTSCVDTSGPRPRPDHRSSISVSRGGASGGGRSARRPPRAPSCRAGRARRPAGGRGPPGRPPTCGRSRRRA